MELLASGIRLTIPIGFVSLGELVGERAGIINIGMEGVMLLCCLAAAWAALLSGSVLVGFLAAILAGMVVLSLMALLCIRFRADQIVVGVGINLVALGGSTVAVKAVPGLSDVPAWRAWKIPGLSELPFVGEVLFSQRITFWVLLVVMGGLVAVLGRTSWGLRVRAVGEEPAAADAAGVVVDRVRVQAMLASGALAGIGGATLAIDYSQGFTENMVAGKGFIALAAVIFGRWNPIGAVGGCLLFGVAEAFRFQLPAWGVTVIPSSVLYMTPYLVALVAIALLRGAARPPAALSVPYRRRR